MTPQAAANNIVENVTIGIQPYADVSYPKDVMYENMANIDKDSPVKRADVICNGFRPSLSTKLKFSAF